MDHIGPTQPPEPAPPETGAGRDSAGEPVIIDTDGGVDDALALLLALRSPDLKVQAITTVAGNISVDQATRNVLTVQDIAGPSARPRVARGCTKPLERPPFEARGIHGEDGLGELYTFRNADGSFRYPPPSGSPTWEHAVDVLLDGARRWGSQLTIITLGPLTNVATAWQRDPAALQRIRRLVVMGGAVTVPGNITPAAEFNFYVDPEAAGIVLQSGIPIVLVGLDVCLQVPLPREDVEDGLRIAADSSAQFIADCTGIYMAFYRDHEHFHGCYLHDPLAVGVAIDSTLVKMEPLLVEVETEGRATTGMSLADHRARREDRPANVQVCLQVDADRFLQLFKQRLWRH